MIATPALPPGLLGIDDLSIGYRGRQMRGLAVRDVSLRLAPGGALGIVGESGSGKTSVALAILGLLGPAAEMRGMIAFEGQVLAAPPSKAMAPRQHRALLGRRIGTVFQDPFSALNPSRRVGVQIAEPMRHHLRVGRADALARTLRLLAEMGFDHPQDIARCYPHQLSGGMQQRAAIAAALSCQPSLLILDEPTTALDVTVEAQILALLAGVRRRHGMALFVISHNLRVIEALCDDVCVMYAGMIVERGPVARVFRDPGHPYTIGLLGSRPRISAPARARLPAIPGYGQGAAREETGCVFARRCTMREGACDGEQAPVRAVDPDHLVLCWKHPARPQADRPAMPPSLRDAGRVHEQLVVAASLSKSYGRSAAAAVDGVSFTIAEGEILGLVGESGCGKSTLGRLVLGLAGANAGSVRFAGSDIGMLKGGALRGFRREAQLIFQNTSSALNPRHTIGRALARPLQLFEMVPPSLRSQRVRELLGMVQLPSDYAFRYPHELSGGERQRVAIARALATEPRFIVCDEAVSALDVSVQAAILNLLADLRDTQGVGYLFISHDLAAVGQIADRIAVMYRGKICEIGETFQILGAPQNAYTKTLVASVRQDVLF